MITIAGIGSRQTPITTLREMKKIGAWCRREHILLKSGHCEGPDWWFEQGAQQFCIGLLPWPRFNTQLKSKAHLYLPPTTQESHESVYRYHPNPSRLSPGGVAMMNRNYFQIAEVPMLSTTIPKTDLVICYTPDGKASGGTGQAMRIAEHMKIPIVNMWYTKYNTANKVIDELIYNINLLEELNKKS